MCSIALFSWWDEVAVWVVGVGWNWLIIPAYYLVEYGVMLPLALVLARKTYRKLGLSIQVRQVLAQSLRNCSPAVVYRKLKRLRRKNNLELISEE